MIDQSNVDRTSSEVSKGARTTRVDALTAVVVEEVVNVLEVVILKIQTTVWTRLKCSSVGAGREARVVSVQIIRVSL